MRTVILGAVVWVVALGCCWGADDAAEIRQKGIQALKDSQSKPGAIVDAARFFAKAGEMYVKAGDESKAVEMNSFLFWCKKKMTYQDIEEFTKTGEKAVAEKLYLVERIAPEADDAQKWFDRADKFAAENPSEHLLIAVRFFEVASRFVGSKPSIAAQERSLKEQALALEKVVVVKVPEPNKEAPAGTSKNAIPTAPAETNDPIRKRVNTAKAHYTAEVEGGRKAVLDGLEKRETDARKIGNKRGVDQVKEERAAFEAKALGEQILTFAPDHRQKILVAWKVLASEYEVAIKEYTKAAKDADADALEKEYKQAAEPHTVAVVPAPATTSPSVPVKGGAASGNLRDKTLVAWILMGELNQSKGSVLSITDASSSHFDAIVFAELEPQRWMAGSDGFLRTQHDQKHWPPETAAVNSPVFLAVVYHGRDVTIYHNGQKYAKYTFATPPQEYDATAFVLFGTRLLSVPQDCFSGAIADARIYAEALSEAQLATLRPRATGGPLPFAWFTFEDGTCKDRMGHFANGKPTPGAMIQNGAMILNGKGYFKADPMPRKK